jgi:hypothetical protein
MSEAPSHILLSANTGGPVSRVQQTTNALLNMSQQHPPHADLFHPMNDSMIDAYNSTS